jgi:hypothetical protein
MKHRIVAAAALAIAACSLAATATAGGKGRLFEFRGTLLSASSSSVQMQVRGGNQAGLHAMVGASQSQTFSIGSHTLIRIWIGGVPHVGTAAELKAGDFIELTVRAHRGASLSTIESRTAATVTDHAVRPAPRGKPLYLYVGTVSGPQSGGHIVLHVTAGNRRGLRTMRGQSADQTFTYNSSTVFLNWRNRIPSTITPAQLKAGDKITVRVHASYRATLSQIEATPATHVGDHEPGNPLDKN